MIELSIIIVNYNTKKITLECIESIKKNPPKVAYEIIVVDNGSAEKFESDKSGLKIIRNKENLGFARANNQGIKSAKGKYILLLNSDVYVKRESINRLYDFALSSNNAGAVVPRLLNSDGSSQPSVFRFPTLWRSIRQYWFGEKELLDKYVPESETVEVATMAAYLITPKCLRKVGLLDERYFFYFEDFDYARRINKSGLKIYYVGEAEVVHEHGVSGKSLADTSNQWRRLIPGSKLYHGFLEHHLIRIIMWTSQKWKKLLNQN